MLAQPPLGSVKTYAAPSLTPPTLAFPAPTTTVLPLIDTELLNEVPSEAVSMAVWVQLEPDSVKT